jgi:hypothetical protein
VRDRLLQGPIEVRQALKSLMERTAPVGAA